MDVFKKLFIATLFITVFISIFCLSSSAAIQYGIEYLDPDYYEDDIGLVVFLLNNQFDDPDDIIVYPLAQYRIPDSTSGHFSLTNLNIYFGIDGFDTVDEFYFLDNTLLEDDEGNSIDLSSIDVVFHDLDTYPITSDYWDDALFASFIGPYDINSNYFEFWSTDLPLTLPSDSNYGEWSDGPIFLALVCDVWDDTVPVYPDEIPTYPARPIITDPPVVDIPLTPENINNFLGKLFESPIDTIVDLFTATNTLYAFISVFVFCMFVRFILTPIFGHWGVGASDRVNSKVKSEMDKQRERKAQGGSILDD